MPIRARIVSGHWDVGIGVESSELVLGVEVHMLVRGDLLKGTATVCGERIAEIESTS